MTLSRTARLSLWLIVAGLLTFVVHEAAHWLMGEALGYPMSYGLNGSYSSTPMTTRDHMLTSAAGPLITIVQAAIAFAIVRVRASLTAYAFLFIAAFMRFGALVVSVVLPNDEARISTALGLGMWTLPAVVVIGLVALTALGSRALGLSWKTNLAAYAVSSVTVAAIVGLDMMMR